MAHLSVEDIINMDCDPLEKIRLIRENLSNWTPEERVVGGVYGDGLSAQVYVSELEKSHRKVVRNRRILKGTALLTVAAVGICAFIKYKK